MSISWGDRFLKKIANTVSKTFPSWSVSQMLEKEGNFLIDEFWIPQTFSGLMYGDVIVKESVWNRYLGRIANPEKNFCGFRISCHPNRLVLHLDFCEWGHMDIQSEVVSLVHNSKESLLVLRYVSHTHEGGNWKSKFVSWLINWVGLKFFSRFYQLDIGSSTRLTQEQEIFRLDFRKSLLESSFSKPLVDGKSLLELIEIESARVEEGKVHLQSSQKGKELLESLGFWIANENEKPES